MATLTIKKQEEIKWDEVKAAVQRGELPEEAEIGFTLKSGESVSLTVTAPKDGKAYLVFSDLTAILPMYDEWPDRPVSWKESSLRRWANEDFIKKLPDELVNIIIPRDIVQTVKGERMETRDLLWAPSYTEIFGKGSRWAEVDDEAETQFPIFATERGRVKMFDGETWHWWSRSPSVNYSTSFVYVASSGSNNDFTASYSYGVCLGLCI